MKVPSVSFFRAVLSVSTVRLLAHLNMEGKVRCCFYADDAITRKKNLSFGTDEPRSIVPNQASKTIKLVLQYYYSCTRNSTGKCETCNHFFFHPQLLGACVRQLDLHVQNEFDPILVLVQVKKLALL